MSNTNDLGFTEKGGYEPTAVGDYDAVIHGIINLGLNPVEFQGQKKDPSVFIKLIYEIPSLIRNDEQTAVIGQRMKLSTNDKSRCYEFLSTVYGAAFNKKNVVGYLNGDGLRALLGKTVSLTVSHFEKDDKNIAYVEKVARLDPRLPQPVPTRELFFFNPLSPDLEVFKNVLTYNTQKQVMEALNANSFPADLHTAWVAIQEDKASDNKSAPFSTAGLNTEAIE